MSTYGPAYDKELDGERIKRQHEAIRDLMLDGGWRTLRNISETLNVPESSASAQLRHLRKPRFGSYLVEKRRTASGGTWEYRVSMPRQSGAVQEELLGENKL